MITTDDVRDAADVFKPAYDDSEGQDGRVSIEVEPTLAHDTEKTNRQAKELWEAVGRENIFIKIPATKEGLPAITATLAAGISVNVTLIFCLDRYKAVVDAFLTGLEQAIENGHDVTKLQRRVVLRQPGRHRGRQAAGRHRHRRGVGPEGQGRDRQRPARVRGVRGDLRHRPLARARDRRREAAASAVGVNRHQGPVVLPHPVRRQPGHRGVVNTMPEATIKAVEEHSEFSGDTVRGDYAADRKVIDDLEKLGISYDEVVQVLEDEGVAKFDASWSDLQDTVTAALKAAAK